MMCHKSTMRYLILVPVLMFVFYQPLGNFVFAANEQITFGTYDFPQKITIKPFFQSYIEDDKDKFAEVNKEKEVFFNEYLIGVCYAENAESDNQEVLKAQVVAAMNVVRRKAKEDDTTKKWIVDGTTNVQRYNEPPRQHINQNEYEPYPPAIKNAVNGVLSLTTDKKNYRGKVMLFNEGDRNDNIFEPHYYSDVPYTVFKRLNGIVLRDDKDRPITQTTIPTTSLLTRYSEDEIRAGKKNYEFTGTFTREFGYSFINRLSETYATKQTATSGKNYIYSVDFGDIRVHGTGMHQDGMMNLGDQLTSIKPDDEIYHLSDHERILRHYYHPSPPIVEKVEVREILATTPMEIEVSPPPYVGEWVINVQKVYDGDNDARELKRNMGVGPSKKSILDIKIHFSERVKDVSVEVVDRDNHVAPLAGTLRYPVAINKAQAARSARDAIDPCIWSCRTDENTFDGIEHWGQAYIMHFI